MNALSHTPLLAQIGSIVILGLVTTGLAIAGIGVLLGLIGNRRLFGGGLLLAGFLGWGGLVFLCAIFTN